MLTNKVTNIFFSPTESTKKVLELINEEIPFKSEYIDVTLCNEQKGKNFDSDDLVIFGVPVYGGRIPQTTIERFKKYKGNNTPAIAIVTFGNRDYNVALLELKELIEENGFNVFAAAAVVTEHSIVHSVAFGRPDPKDKVVIKKFINNALNKLELVEKISQISVKGKHPFKEYNGIPLKPITSNDCVLCGECANNCPVNAIPKDNPKLTNKDKCISCLRCINICPVNARKINPMIYKVCETSLKAMCHKRVEPDIYL